MRNATKESVYNLCSEKCAFNFLRKMTTIETFQVLIFYVWSRAVDGWRSGVELVRFHRLAQFIFDIRMMSNLFIGTPYLNRSPHTV